MRIPPIDPTETPSLYKRALTPIALSGAGQWYLRHLAPGLDRGLAKLTAGRVTSVPGVPFCLLTTTGAKSGQQRVNPLVYFSDGERVVCMASNYGGGRHPGWFHNIKANPEVTLFSRGREGRYRAEITSGEERERLWSLAKGYVEAYEMYEGMTAGTRQIPVVAFTPLDPA